MDIKLKIRNIKHFGEEDNELSFTLEKDKLNLMFATNGVGKTSIATAFKYLGHKKYTVPIEDRHKKRKDAVCSLTLSAKGDGEAIYHDYVADSRKDRISPEFTTYVIRNRVKAITKAEEVGDDAISRSHMAIEKIVIMENIPNRDSLQYDVNSIRLLFGKKKALIENLQPQLQNDAFLDLLSDIEPILQFSVKTQKMHDEVMRVTNHINGMAGNARTVAANIEDRVFNTLYNYQRYQNFVNCVDNRLGAQPDRLSYFLLFFQLHHLYNSNKFSFINAVNRRKYEMLKSRLDVFFKSVRLPWNNIELREDDGCLSAVYPLANEMSNGERDILSLVCQLEEFKHRFESGKKCILIIDEIFDYLDDANMLAAEYYINELFSTYKNEELYVMLFSHLEVRYFRNHIFNDARINQQYLLGNKQAPNAGMKGFIAFRSNLKPTENDLYVRISRNLFHYSPDDEDITRDLDAIKAVEPNRIKPIKAAFYTKTKYNEYLIWELMRYLSGKIDPKHPYDPYAVCMAIRIYSEKMIYNKLPDEASKLEFIKTHETLNKIDYCRNKGIEVHDYYRMLASIHNDACHMPLEGTGKDIERIKKGMYESEKAMIFKLQNNVIRNIIATLFEYEEGTMIPLDLLQQ